jgi:hypothetical protein
MLPFKKGFTPYIFLLIILSGVAIALYLIRNPQVFSPKAQEANPVTFTLKQPAASCINGRPSVSLEWTTVTDGILSADQTIVKYFGWTGFNYEVFYREINGPEVRVGSAKYNLSYVLSTLDGLQPGHSYGFLISARSPSFGPVYASRGWSDGIYGWLTLPGCGPSTTGSPAPASLSPSPAKTGDLDNNNTVDIFDFNIFVGDFQTQNLRSDLDDDGDVDIFDFNILVGAFQGP